MFVDIRKQCFALSPQVIFPANNLNFHCRWRWWDQIQSTFLNLFYFTGKRLPLGSYNLTWASFHNQCFQKLIKVMTVDSATRLVYMWRTLWVPVLKLICSCGKALPVPRLTISGWKHLQIPPALSLWQILQSQVKADSALESSSLSAITKEKDENLR